MRLSNCLFPGKEILLRKKNILEYELFRIKSEKRDLNLRSVNYLVTGPNTKFGNNCSKLSTWHLKNMRKIFITSAFEVTYIFLCICTFYLYFTEISVLQVITPKQDI